MRGRTLVTVGIVASLLLAPVVALQDGAWFDETKAPHRNHEPEPAHGDLVAQLATLVAQGALDTPEAQDLCTRLAIPCTIGMSHSPIPGDDDDDGLPADVETFYCENLQFPSVPALACLDDDYAPPTGTLPEAPETPAAPDGPGDAPRFVQDVAAFAYEQLEPVVDNLSAIMAAQGIGSMTLAANETDADDDERPDHYTLSIRTDGRLTQIHLQSDLYAGNATNGEPMVVIPATGQSQGSGLHVAQSGGQTTLTFSADDQPLLSIRFAPDDPQELLVLRILDEDLRFIAAPTYPVPVDALGVEEEEPVFFSAPFDIGYVRVLGLGDLDGDGYPDALEALAASNPLNAASRPGNLDGDLCAHRSDPDDRNPRKCRPFGYDLAISTPDSDLTDGAAVAWGDVTLAITADVLAGLDFTPRPIERYDVYLSPAGVAAHEGNITLESDPHLHPECDLDDSDGGTEHDQCPYFTDGDDRDEWIHLCGATGSWTSLAATCDLDTRDLEDEAEYHVWVFACLEDEPCREDVVDEQLDRSDHVAVSHHFEVTNKPSLGIADVLDLDGVNDRAGHVSDALRIDLDASHVLGYPIVGLELEVTSQRTAAGEQVDVETQTWSFDVEGLVIGQATGNLTADGDPLASATATATRVDADTFNVTIDTNELSQAFPSPVLQIVATAYAKEPSGDLAPPASATTTLVPFLNNHAPTVALDAPSVRHVRSDGTAQTTLEFDYLDGERGGTPTIDVRVAHSNGTAIADSITCSLHSGRVYDGVYRCRLTTAETDLFSWTLNVTDTDAGDNNSGVQTGADFEITNTPPALSDGLAQVDAGAYTEDTDGHRTVAINVTYTDPEDDPQDISIEIVNLTDGSTVTHGLDLCAGADAPRTAEQRHCLRIQLPYGEYEYRFEASGMRPGDAEFPAGGDRLGLVVEPRVSCEGCVTDDATRDQGDESVDGAIGAANQSLLLAPGLPNVYAAAFGCPCEGDEDDDGFSDTDEADAGSDPANPWSNPVDRDADLWPNAFDEGVLDLELFQVGSDGHVAVGDELHVRAYTQTAPGAERGTPLLNVTLLADGALYDVSVNTATQEILHLDDALLEYTAGSGGVRIAVVDSETGGRVLTLDLNATALGSPSEPVLTLHQAGSVLVFVHSNPIRVVVNGDETVAVPAGVRDDGSGGLEPYAAALPLACSLHAALDAALCYDEPGDPDGDPDGDGLSNQTEAILCATALSDAFCETGDFDPCNPDEVGSHCEADMSDEDSDGFPAFVEAALCGSGAADPYCDDGNFTAPAVADPDADDDGIPDALEATLCAQATLQHRCTGDDFAAPGPGDADDGDHDDIPDSIEALLCATGALTTSCTDDNLTAREDADDDGVPDLAESVVCGTLGDQAGICADGDLIVQDDADQDAMPDVLEAPICGAPVWALVAYGVCDGPTDWGADGDNDGAPDTFENGLCTESPGNTATSNVCSTDDEVPLPDRDDPFGGA